MKSKKQYILILTFILFAKTKTFGQMAVIDPTVNASVITQFITSLTQLYEMYDHTMNQIEMIQQKYEQMQFYVDRAANWKWQDVEWDGDLDFRNEISQATRNIDRQLTNIRKIKNSLTTNTVSWGGQSYSIASLAGINIDGQGNLADFVKEGAAYYDNGFKKAAKYWAEGVPDNEAQYIWSKYGLNPANYRMVRDVEAKVQEKAAYLIGLTEDSPEVKEVESERGKVLDEIMKMLQSDDEMTEGQIQSIMAMLQQQTVLELSDFKKTLNQAIGYMAWYNQLLAQEKEAEAQSKIEKMKEANKNQVSSYF